MGRRLHSLLTEAWHLVLLVAAVGIAVSGIAAIIGFAAGKRGGHEVVVVVIALGVVGCLGVLAATLLDPMGSFSPQTSSFSPLRGFQRASAPVGLESLAEQGELMTEMEHGEAGLPAEMRKQFRRDDLLYAGGVLLIGLAVLFGFACKWAGVPPANPFG